MFFQPFAPPGRAAGRAGGNEGISVKLSFQTAGLPTWPVLLVKTPVDAADRPAIAGKLKAIRELGAKDVFFLTPPQGKGVVRVETVTGAVSGTALLLGGLSFAVGRGIRRDKKLPVEIGGSNAPCTVQINPLAGHGAADLPLPLWIGSRPFLSEAETAPMVCLPGLVCVLRSGEALPEEAVLAPALEALARENEVPSAAALLWNFRAGSLSAVRWQAGEAGCTALPCGVAAAGAAAAWSARHGTDGHHRLTIRQPGGALDTDAVVKGGRLQRLTVSGPVVLGPEYVVEF